MRRPSDHAARERALAPNNSFIVQAPAGSGKTELLTRRFLRLLPTVQDPEQIVAITFTRKAAAEMRYRILEALELATGPKPGKSPESELWEIAKAALDHDERNGWRLRESSGRLRIQTIDSLCASITRQMPVLSRFGAIPEITEDADALYQVAAQRTLSALEEDDPSMTKALEILFTHLDGNFLKLEHLLIAELKRRDQWLRFVLPLIGDGEARDFLENSLKRLIEDHMAQLEQIVPRNLAVKLPSLLKVATKNLASSDPGSPLLNLQGIKELPGFTVEDVPLWSSIAELLLTKAGTPRASVNKNQGFPAGKAFKDDKEEMKALIGSMRPTFVDRLHGVRSLPPDRYTETQWAVIEALLLVMRRAAAELQLVFANTGEVDFVEVSQAALRALGDQDAPTDLALLLDYQIRHLLVDEFQDTSLSQNQLLERLTAGWESGDERSLFLVGDPMQSIYRFREAEVGLFLQAQQVGIGSVSLKPIHLTENFRSQKGIVDWVNGTFDKVLAAQDEPETGAVSYSASTAWHPAAVEPAVVLHPSLVDDREGEATQVVDLIQDRLAVQPKHDQQLTIGVLARNRSHLSHIADELTHRGIRFQAVDVTSLAAQPVVQDLFALTRALLHPGDRLAWLTLLRAPWCGLGLADLLVLAQQETQERTIWEVLQDSEQQLRLTDAGRDSVERVIPILEVSMARRRRSDLRRLVESTWLRLGGPAVVASKAALEDAEAYLRLLESSSQGGTVVNIEDLSSAIGAMYAPPDVQADGRVQLMTMHKAKGLQFDCVILPGLARRPRNDDPPLLRVVERPLPDGIHADLVMAPIYDALEKNGPIYDYLKSLDKQKGDHEVDRLLYVACTRAKSELHLFGHATPKSDEEVSAPDSRTLLRRLWPMLDGAFYELLGTQNVPKKGVSDKESYPRMLRRLDSDWALPETTAPAVDIPVDQSEAIVQEPKIPFDWASILAIPVGIVVHRYLEQIAVGGVDKWSHDSVLQQRPAIATLLRHEGLVGDDLERAVERVIKALEQVLDDQRARWILDPNHQQAESEYPLTIKLVDEYRNMVVDRTFIEDGKRWIIDYKTGHHEGGKLEHFLDTEQERYQPQLEGYAQAFHLRGEEEIWLGLYFPMMGGWREWQFLTVETST